MTGDPDFRWTSAPSFPELLSAHFLEGIDLILASPSMLATHLSNSNREHTPTGPDVSQHITRLVLHLSESQPGRFGYI